MIRCVRLWTGEDQNSYFEEGWLELETGPHADLLTGKIPRDDRFVSRDGIRRRA